MAIESTAPPPPGGNLKYALVGLVLLLLAGGGLFWALRGGSPPPPVTDHGVDAGTSLARPTSLQQTGMEIPDIPDSGEPWDAGPPHIRYITRYVGGGGNWDCSGDIDQGQVRTALQEYKTQIRNCYERRLKVNNTLQGRVQLSVKVGANGRVQGVNVGGSLRDPDVFACVRTVANSMHFPTPQGGACAVVNVPYDFTPRSN